MSNIDRVSQVITDVVVGAGRILPNELVLDVARALKDAGLLFDDAVNETQRGLFFDEVGESVHPTVLGGSAGINSAMFFTCPRCGSVVLDMHFERIGRDRHERWHQNDPRSETQP